jgi:hypothetical protein
MQGLRAIRCEIKARLMSSDLISSLFEDQLAYELATPDAEPPPAHDAWSRLDAFWRDIEARGPAAPGATAQLLADRQQRQATLEGRDERGA